VVAISSVGIPQQRGFLHWPSRKRLHRSSREVKHNRDAGLSQARAPAAKVCHISLQWLASCPLRRRP
jgi:hypothetical protein